MKLWEVLKALEENPNKVFRSGIGNDIEHEITIDGGYYYYCRYKDGKLIEGYPDANGFNGNAGINQYWEEVKQPVPWQEALKAWSVGKKIRCEILNRTYVYDRSIYTALQSGRGGYLVADEIVNGTWYIEN